jgi:hypothetical protein
MRQFLADAAAAAALLLAWVGIMAAAAVALLVFSPK